ncbi:hypothetical protein SAMN05892883_2084 [Jatrophihabitans sp. GAS493]|uniref:hypothetical protein n=1 Tax=Jatrophihabitans sp. GAS493 TaxID=1907575 RepID=UPI000BB71EF6|nr:hypothetical protein [Jatrophihabitans sp. GAS493]SOD72737.1 hypothetical protein SAMN05892883_2084 [Jatrophihabitans sp. GAS493]
MANTWVAFKGGPMDGRVELGSHDGDTLWDALKPPARYRLNGETLQTTDGPIPVAEFVVPEPKNIDL